MSPSSRPRFRSSHVPTLAERAVMLVGRLVVMVLVLLALWVPGLVWFVASMPGTAPDTTTRTDAVVVLTGGSERLRNGLVLLDGAAAGQLFVSGVHPGTGLDALLAETGLDLPDDQRARIDLGHVAADTVGNAIETAVWVRDQGHQSVRLVTASYHMPRSLLEFRAAMPGVTIVPHPVFPQHVKQDDWWRYPGTTSLFVTEYTKYLVAHLRLLMPDRPHRVVASGQTPPQFAAPNEGTQDP